MFLLTGHSVAPVSNVFDDGSFGKIFGENKNDILIFLASSGVQESYENS